MYGVCKICGCTDDHACHSPILGNCWWVDDTHELCSHCEMKLKSRGLLVEDVAWATWVLTNISYSGSPVGGWKWDNGTAGSHTGIVLEHYREQFTRKLHERLQNVQISQRDAIEVIKQRDTADTFFYLDPPYPGCNQKHYKGFTDKNLEELLVVLEKIKGKFLLSNYARDVLVEKAQANEWYVFRKDMPLKVANFNGNSRRKTEGPIIS